MGRVCAVDKLLVGDKLFPVPLWETSKVVERFGLRRTEPTADGIDEEVTGISQSEERSADFHPPVVADGDCQGHRSFAGAISDADKTPRLSDFKEPEIDFEPGYSLHQLDGDRIEENCFPWHFGEEQCRVEFRVPACRDDAGAF